MRILRGVAIFFILLQYAGRALAQSAPLSADHLWHATADLRIERDAKSVCEPAFSLDPVKTYALAELVDLAESHNPETRVAWEQARAQAASLGIARSELYPTLAATAVAGVHRDEVYFTSVVVRDLFHNAKDSVVVIGYAIRQGQQVFQALANRMSDIPGLHVRMCLDIPRDSGDSSVSSEIVTRFVDQFRRGHWPSGKRLPKIFYDPRSLAPGPRDRASLHAKCIIIDARDVFVSSANFTEAGQSRNIEVGLLLQSAVIAERLLRFFETLVGGG